MNKGEVSLNNITAKWDSYSNRFIVWDCKDTIGYFVWQSLKKGNKTSIYLYFEPKKRLTFPACMLLTISKLIDLVDKESRNIQYLAKELNKLEGEK